SISRSARRSVASARSCHRHLLAGALQLRRELGTQLQQLPLERLELGGLSATRVRGQVGLALGIQFTASQNDAASALISSGAWWAI
ncbi:hypothetical protein, partial [Cupriavidus sp. CuC1]|uniref:hypothetical protein n=1 Tax=Cupriavidus sp. CuC1 TaxID=3373131 RepID=UPI0037D0260B